ncbi:DUF4352 domain-containing protein [Actinobaculum sp. 352]|uniref:DUF4352 domain-containing protein n=1 Tax=Actinobaculum sp. 352 TaxID=2490946 RepID=UPI000F7F4D87|nr:DUF4352 domain-containing protein [Actinobaculum sp. 352]RTE47662.1 DUF4352 domain-containing protein [Actinobaculum sp. 352]
MTTPPTGPQLPHSTSQGRQSHATNTSGTTNDLPNTATSHAARQGLPGWAWTLLGTLIVIAVVIAGIMIAGRNHTTPTTATSSGTTSPAPASTPTMPEPTVSPTSGVTQIGDWSVEVLEYKPDVTEYLTTYDPPVELTVEDNRFLGIKLRVTNTGERANAYTQLGQRLDGYTEGRKVVEPYYIDTVDYRGDDYLAEVRYLEPGESGEGWLFYQVRGDFELTTIEMQDKRDRDNPTPWTEVPYPQPANATPTPTTTP